MTETCADDFATIWVACRICAASVRARCPKPQPTKTVYARGSMEWLTGRQRARDAGRWLENGSRPGDGSRAGSTSRTKWCGDG